MKRSFLFDSFNGIHKETIDEVKNNSKRLTTVSLKGFSKIYRDNSYKTGLAISNSLLEHCLWYFIRPESAPKIIINDGESSINLNHLYKEYVISSTTKESVSFKDEKFNLTHAKLRASSNRPHHIIGLCAANRLVKEANISGKIPGLHGNLRDGDSEFVYACYVGSEFLDARVRSERTDFDIPEKLDPLFAEQDISLSEIREFVIEKASDYLSDYLSENKRLADERMRNFIAHKAPRYRPILPRISADDLEISPSTSDKDLELKLHKELSSIESKMLADGHDLMKPKAEDDFEDYAERLKEYLFTAEDIKKSDLTNYVFHRKVILDLFSKAIQRTDAGKYSREDLIHTLLIPMRTDSNEVKPIDCNLWLIDERLAFHDYLASDKPLSSMPITGSTETKEPDIAVLNVFDNPFLVSDGERMPLASIVVIEIKRPMRNDAKEGEEKDPIEQAMRYLDRIRTGQVKTSSGRPIPRSETIPGFCYVLCDITPTVEERCKMHDAVRTSDGLGYFFYHKAYMSYVEILSFDRLVNSAKERNRAFFDKL